MALSENSTYRMHPHRSTGGGAAAFPEETAVSGIHLHPRPEEERSYVPYKPSRYMTEAALAVRERSLDSWGERRAVTIVGLSRPLERMLAMVLKVASFDEPVLITGESGSGKELVAQALYLLGPRRGRPFVTVNCPQYHEGNLTVSELFGHKKGSFTGAVADRKGCFEVADRGDIFLDEVGDLPLSTQVMLLRALATGEFFPLGATTPREVSVRVLAATNRNLEELRGVDQFREDLFFRLAYFRVDVPPLREREDDWALLAEYFLRNLSERYGVVKTFSSESVRILAAHDWPGNIRELASVVTNAYAMADGRLIQPQDFTQKLLQLGEPEDQLEEVLWRRIKDEGQDFWSTFHAAFMDRDVNRSQVKKMIRRGLLNTQGSYRRLLEELRLPASDYQRLMDFLRHHRLKP